VFKYYFNTTVANTTMRTSWWPVKSARGTPFHSHLYCVYFCRLIQRRLEVITGVFVFWCWNQFTHYIVQKQNIITYILQKYSKKITFGYYTWIHERCQREVCYDKKRHYAMNDRYPWIKLSKKSTSVKTKNVGWRTSHVNRIYKKRFDWITTHG